MQFFLYEVVARIVAIYLCVDCYRKLRNGLVERKIKYFSPDLLDWWSMNRFVDRDAAPVRYWIEVGIHTTVLLSCLAVAVFGWWQPKS